MGDKTKIEWTDATWTPIRAHHKTTGKVGWHCEHVSEGCRNCYAEGMNKRRGTGLNFKPGHRKDIELFLDEKMLLAPLRWKKPRMIFVCSMTDLFADFVPDEWIDKVLAVMALCPQHTFQVLTKRSKRMRVYIASNHVKSQIAKQCALLLAKQPKLLKPLMMSSPDDDEAWGWPVDNIGDDPDWPEELTLRNWPLSNVWLGASCEDQAAADERIPDLLATPAAVRFVSAEPLIGPIDFSALHGGYVSGGSVHADMRIDALTGRMTAAWKGRNTEFFSSDKPRIPHLDQIIVGGESGPGARPMRPQWVRDIRDQCKAAGVAFHFKQWGEWSWASDDKSFDEAAFHAKLTFGKGVHLEHHSDGRTAARVGKSRAGRLLDGEEHNGMPDTAR